MLRWLAVAACAPNIVLILTDDQDALLDSFQALPKTKRLLGAAGSVNFTNMFVAAPVCCVNRASIVSGQFQHNTRTFNNSVAGGCSSPWFQAEVEPHGFGVGLQAAGYQTAYFGKYLNTYGLPEAGGVEHVPPGWSNWQGLKGNSQYYHYTLSNNGQAEEHGTSYAEDYLTDVIKNKSLAWMEQVHAQPFAAVLATPAAHGPWDAAPQYQDRFSGVKAPRTPNYDTAREGKHHLIAAQPPMDADRTEYSDLTYRRRLQALLSVDDLVEELMAKLEALGVLDNTYVFFTSDNGFHMGQFSMPYDKRLPYETDVRVPLLVRTPTAGAARVAPALVSSVDLAPTFLELAGAAAQDVDGVSFAAELAGTARGGREEVLVEYMGEDHGDTVPHACFETAPQYNGSSWGPWLQDEHANTYACLRQLGAQNAMYCRFFATYADKDAGRYNFEEYYDLAADPWQLHNTAAALPSAARAALGQRLEELRRCRGAQCAPQRAILV